MVSIRCITYNHEPYIRQCLEGFVMQKTNFKFEAIVHDDASTDHTADIIREYAAKYPDIIKPIYETENQYSKYDGSIRRILDAACTGKYIAMCEGDDYWIDPLKLQKQVDFLEASPEYGLCHTDFTIQDESGKNEKKKKRIYPSGDVLLNILGKKGSYIIGTCTALYRKSIYDEIPKLWCEKNFKMGDAPLWIELSRKTKVKYLSNSTAVYRRLSSSASHSSDINKRVEFIKSGFDCRNFYCSVFNLPMNPISRFYVSVIKIAFVERNKEIAKEYFKKLCSTGYKNISVKAILFFCGTMNGGVRRFVNLLYKF